MTDTSSICDCFYDFETKQNESTKEKSTLQNRRVFYLVNVKWVEDEGIILAN